MDETRNLYIRTSCISSIKELDAVEIKSRLPNPIDDGNMEKVRNDSAK